MRFKREYHINQLTQRDGEYHGAYCIRLAQTVKEIVETRNTSSNALHILAFVLMKAPANFDYCYSPPPFRTARKFLGNLSDETKREFRYFWEKLPERNEDRLESLLSSA